MQYFLETDFKRIKYICDPSSIEKDEVHLLLFSVSFAMVFSAYASVRRYCDLKLPKGKEDWVEMFILIVVN